jgi:3-dehydroquinate synthase
MLLTLPDDEYYSGLAELIKTGIIGEKTIIDILEDNYKGIINRDKNILSDLVSRAVKFKASIVSKDEKESGLRRVLNFGHTFGHAIELNEAVKHGFAVASGIKLATYFSLKKGLIKEAEYNRIFGLLKKYKLSADYPVSVEKMGNFLIHDKKKSGRDINFVFTKGIGKAVVKKIPVKEVIDFYRDFKSVK